MMSHSCKQLQSELNFWFTQEQVTEMPEELRRQVTICPDCREYLKNYKEVMHVLRSEQENSSARLSTSLWPQIQQRLNSQVIIANDVRRRTPGRLLSAERTNIWSQRIAVMSISVAIITVLTGPLLQFLQTDRGEQVGYQHSFQPQYEFTKFSDTEENPRLPTYLGNKNYGIYQDVTFSGSRLNQKGLGEKYHFLPEMKEYSDSSISIGDVNRTNQ